jgi:tetratricopeptide (TPR) repeat protein
MKSTLVRLILLSFLILVFIPNLTTAETKTFIKEYTYQASEFDSKASSRTIALEQVKRLLLEELGTYLETSTEVKDFQLTRDQIKALSAGIVQTTILDENWDGKQFWLKARIMADPDEVTKNINFLRKDREKTEEYEGANKKVDVALREIEKLRKEVELVKKDKTQIARYDQAIQDLSATEWYRKGLTAMRTGNYNEAISAYTKAVRLDPQYVLAYIDRSFAYSRLGNFQQVFENANKAIELDPRNARAYVNRGFAHSKLGHYQQAIEDANKAVELNPKYVLAYVNRGDAYSRVGNNQQAFKDANKAIELDSRNVMAYVNRGLAYSRLGNNQQAIEDYNKAIELDPKYALAYYYRGTAYAKLGKKDHAASDYETAARLGYKVRKK